jgi:hypothetical protein
MNELYAISQKITKTTDTSFKDELRLVIFDHLNVFQFKLEEVRNLWMHY